MPKSRLGLRVCLPAHSNRSRARHLQVHCNLTVSHLIPNITQEAVCTNFNRLHEQAPRIAALAAGKPSFKMTLNVILMTKRVEREDMENGWGLIIM